MNGPIKMKNTILLLAFVLCGISQAVLAEDFGKQVAFYQDKKQPQFGVIYSNDTDVMVVMNLTLWAGDLMPTHKMKSLAWRLYDSGTNQYVNAWTVESRGSGDTFYPGTIAFSWSIKDKNEAISTMKSLSKLKVLFSVDGNLSAPTPTHFIDLGSYCTSNPDNFINLTSSHNGCSMK